MNFPINVGANYALKVNIMDDLGNKIDVAFSMSGGSLLSGILLGVSLDISMYCPVI